MTIRIGSGLLRRLVERDLQRIFFAHGIPNHSAALRPSKRPELSDFQCNGLLSYAATVGMNPRELGAQLRPELNESDKFDCTIDGPGFLNFAICDDTLVEELAKLGEEPNWALQSDAGGRTVFLDFGGPNVAKELHVGHLRSALIGQSLANIMRRNGYTVIADVHLGDWGLPMGLTIAQIESEDISRFDASDLGAIYAAASQRSKTDPEFLAKAREVTAKLQAGDEQRLQLWNKMLQVSITSIKQTYDCLGVSFDQWNGESSYRQTIPKIIEAAKLAGLAQCSDGALIVPSRDKTIPPLILRTSAGAVGYATTDIAALSTRVSTFVPDEILYVVDKRQSLHFEQVFDVSRRLGIVGACHVEHVAFGTVNGSDGRPFKTRDGQVMRLRDLIHLMVDGASVRLADRPNVSDPDGVSWCVALAALKYGELSHDRNSNYVFDPDQFLAFEGNTGPYLLYSSVRVNTLLARASDVGKRPGSITELGDGGRKIAILLDGYGESLDRTIEQRKPSILAAHLYALANEINSFYQRNPILAGNVTTKAAESFLAILSIANSQLRDGLHLLGIQVPEQM